MMIDVLSLFIYEHSWDLTLHQPPQEWHFIAILEHDIDRFMLKQSFYP
jgi:hypothetical protein